MRKLVIVVAVALVLGALVMGQPAHAAGGSCNPYPQPTNYWYFDWGEMPGEMDRYIFVDLDNGDQVRIIGRPGDQQTDPDFYLEHVVSNSGCLLYSFSFGTETVDYLNYGAKGDMLNHVTDPNYFDFLDEARWLR